MPAPPIHPVRGARAHGRSVARIGAAGHADTVWPARPVRSAPSMASIRVEPLLPTLILVWIAGVSMLSLRLLTGWIWVQRLRTHGNAPAEDQWQRMATRLSRRLHIGRAITLLESTLVDVPTVIGWLKPVVLLPASALGALSPQQLEGDPRARARAHPPARLPGQPAADARRDAPLLSPGGLVAFAAHPHRARELLRRSRRQPLRRSRGLRERAGRSRIAASCVFRLAEARGSHRDGGDGRRAAAARPPPARRPLVAHGTRSRRGSPAASRCS